MRSSGIFMADTKAKPGETHTAEEWAKKWMALNGTRMPEKRISREEYEKMMRNQAIAKGLINIGKKTLGSIAGTVATGGKKFLTELGDRLAENADEAVGSPIFGGGVRDAIFGPQQPRPTPQYAVQMANPLQYTPEELALIQSITQGNTGVGGVSVPGTAGYSMGAGGYGAMPEKQVVFLFDSRNDTITEVLGEFNTVPEAAAETEKLRGQGLPAFYATKSFYLEKQRLKS